MPPNDAPLPVGLDLATITLEDTAELELVHPKTGEGLGLTLTLAGPEHDIRRQHRFRVQREARRRLAQTRGMNIAKALAAGDPEEEEGEVTAYLVACTIGWRQGAGATAQSTIPAFGERLACTPANVRRVYEARELAWVRGQVRAFLDDAENFIVSSPTP